MTQQIIYEIKYDNNNIDYKTAINHTFYNAGNQTIQISNTGTDITGTLSVTSDTTIQGSMQLNGTLNVDSNATVNNLITNSMIFDSTNNYEIKYDGSNIDYKTDNNHTFYNNDNQTIQISSTSTDINNDLNVGGSLNIGNLLSVVNSISCTSIETTNDVRVGGNLFVDDNINLDNLNITLDTGIIKLGSSNQQLDNSNINKIKLLGAGEIGFGYIDDSIIYASHSGHLFYYGESIGMELNDTDLSVKGTLSVISNTTIGGNLTVNENATVSKLFTDSIIFNESDDYAIDLVGNGYTQI